MFCTIFESAKYVAENHEQQMNCLQLINYLCLILCFRNALYNVYSVIFGEQTLQIGQLVQQASSLGC